MIEAKRRIIKEKLGELGHIDLRQLPTDCFLSPPAKPHYVICLIDACSRLAWAEVVAAKKALPVMFKALKMINTLHPRYGVVFTDILSDNGAEFAARAHPNEHPFEAMLLELGVRHRYTRPYRPQTPDVIDKCPFLLDLSYFPPAHGRPRGEEQGARRKPCRAAFIVAPRLRRPCAPALDHADSNRRRSARTPSRLARPTCAPDRDGS